MAYATELWFQSAMEMISKRDAERSKMKTRLSYTL